MDGSDQVGKLTHLQLMVSDVFSDDLSREKWMASLEFITSSRKVVFGLCMIKRKRQKGINKLNYDLFAR